MSQPGTPTETPLLQPGLSFQFPSVTVPMEHGAGPAAAPQPTVVVHQAIPDSLAPRKFDGSVPKPEDWFRSVEAWAEFAGKSPVEFARMFPLFLEGQALTWWGTQSQATRSTRQSITEAFMKFFGATDMEKIYAKESVLNTLQEQGQSVRDYTIKMQSLAKKTPSITPEALILIIMRGLLPQVRAFILQRGEAITTIDEIICWGKLAETAQVTDPDVASTGLLQAVQQALTASENRLSSRIDTLQIQTVAASSARRSSPSPVRAPDKQVRFAQNPPSYNQRMSPNQGSGNVTYTSRGTTSGGSFTRPTFTRGRPSFRGAFRGGSRGRGHFETRGNCCYRCGRQHPRGNDEVQCQAFTAVCYACNRRGHFSTMCFATRGRGSE